MNARKKDIARARLELPSSKMHSSCSESHSSSTDEGRVEYGGNVRGPR